MWNLNVWSYLKEKYTLLMLLIPKVLYNDNPQVSYIS